MFQSIQHSLLLGLIPFGTILIGGLIAVFFKIAKTIQSAILHFAAGVVFSVVAVEILPDVVRIHRPLQIILGFLFGMILMLLLKFFITKLENKTKSSIEKKSFPLTLFIGIAIDVLIDGLLVGIAFSVGNKEGFLLTLAIGIELFSLGLATATSFREKAISKSRTILYIGLLGLVFLVSLALGLTLLHNIKDLMLEFILSFGLSALLFLVVEELLTEAHEVKESPWQTSAFFAGFLLFLIMGMYL
nr:transporter [uncultured Pedobacter sp.]